ncbi:MAG: hypothetical protein V9G14_15860 [Cypionkella sp.]
MALCYAPGAVSHVETVMEWGVNAGALAVLVVTTVEGAMNLMSRRSVYVAGVFDTAGQTLGSIRLAALIDAVVTPVGETKPWRALRSSLATRTRLQNRSQLRVTR